ncbi:type 4b pilus protein PilO2 [Xenorhabdus nematophila]|uniref:type 4b pilus protein PilO2 n=1 Tax=Xenorhabdus nematophila TaxID=628 RepID=UPI0032B7F6D3
MYIKIGKCKYILEMNWLSVPSGKGALRALISKNKRSYDSKILITSGEKSVVGFTALPRNNGGNNFHSLAAEIMPLLGQNGYAVALLDSPIEIKNTLESERKYVFFGAINALPTLVGDIVGNYHQIKKVVDSFKGLNKEPEEGWNVISSLENPIRLQELISEKAIKRSKLEPLYNRKPIYAVIILFLIYWIGEYAFNYWQERIEENRRIEAQKILMKEAGKSETAIENFKPWAKQIPAKKFLELCQNTLTKISVPVAGWRLTGGICENNTISLGYVVENGGTITEFTKRAEEIIGHRPAFNLLSGGETGTIKFPLIKNSPNMDVFLRSEELPDINLQLIRIIDFFQKKRESIKFSSAINNLGQDGKTYSWVSINYSFQTKLAPKMLLEKFDDSGFRVNSVTFSISKKGKIQYDVKGTVYAKQ